MQVDESIEQALRSSEPFHSLRSVAQQLFSQGKDSPAVLAVFERARQQLREAGREADEDAVMDVMDCLVGWCGSHMKLVPPDGTDAQANGGVTHSSELVQPVQPTSPEESTPLT